MGFSRRAQRKKNQYRLFTWQPGTLHSHWLVANLFCRWCLKRQVSRRFLPFLAFHFLRPNPRTLLHPTHTNMVSHKTRRNRKKFVPRWRSMAPKLALLAIFVMMGYTWEPSSKQLRPTRKQAPHPAAAAATTTNVEGMTRPDPTNQRPKGNGKKKKKNHAFALLFFPPLD